MFDIDKAIELLSDLLLCQHFYPADDDYHAVEMGVKGLRVLAHGPHQLDDLQLKLLLGAERKEKANAEQKRTPPV